MFTELTQQMKKD